MTCHFRAEMEEEVELAKVCHGEVTISREAIEKLAGRGGGCRSQPRSIRAAS